jgi:tetratricopeptide (TPR) repeat protein
VAVSLKCFSLIVGSSLCAVAALAPGAPAQQPAKPAAAESAKPAQDRRGDAYYNFSMGKYFEEQYDDSGRSEHANQAIEFYRKAYQLDPGAGFIGERLAEMYYKAQRIRDAVLELQGIIAREPQNLSARRLLGRIYVRTLGDRSSGAGSRDIVARAIEQYREVCRQDPADAESAVTLARLYRMAGESGKAEEVLRGVLAADPENSAVLRQLTQSLLDRGDSAGATQLLEAAIARNPSADAYTLLGDAAMQSALYPRAEQAYRSALERDAGNRQALRKLARSLQMQDKNDAAAEQYLKLAKIEPEEAANFLRLAQIYRELRKLDAAEENLLRARQLSPGNLEVQYTEALLYDDQGRFDDAIRVLSSALSAVKANSARLADGRRTLVIFYDQLGRLYRETENFSSAVATYREMLKLGPEEERHARALLADTYRESKNMPAAIAECDQAREAFPGDRGLSVTCALLRGENGETDQAAAALRALLRGDASDRDMHISLAQVLERGKRYDAAAEQLHLAEKLAASPAENEAAWFLLGAIYDRQKKHELAEEQFKRVLELNPHNAQALNYYGYMLAERGQRLDEAAALIQRALDEDPNSGAYLDSLGWTRFQQGEYTEAERLLRRAVERASQDPTIREHLGDLYAKTGRPDLAAKEYDRSLAEWKRAIPADRDDERAAAVDKKLTGLKHRVAQKSPAGNKQ